MELVTQHTHTDMTNHGHAPIEELIARAHRVGITNIAVTEHYPLTPQVDPRDFVSMHADRLPEYFERILAQRAKYPDMEVLVSSTGSGKARIVRLPPMNSTGLISCWVRFIFSICGLLTIPLSVAIGMRWAPTISGVDISRYGAKRLFPRRPLPLWLIRIL